MTRQQNATSLISHSKNALIIVLNQFLKAAANVPWIHCLPVKAVNVWSVLRNEWVIMDRKGWEQVGEFFGDERG